MSRRPLELPPMYPGGCRVGAEEEAAVVEVLRSRRLFRYYGAVDGPSAVAAFEADFTRRFGTKHAIAVASGTGGVGKSTVAVNMALALSAEGATVGILDADIYGPSQPRMLGISGKPESKDGSSLEPMSSYDLQAMSIGFLIDEETPMIWRGPMVTQALEQLLRQVEDDPGGLLRQRFLLQHLQRQGRLPK